MAVNLTPAMCERILDAVQEYERANLAWKAAPFDEAKIEAHARSITALADLAAEIGARLKKAKAEGLYVPPSHIN